MDRDLGRQVAFDYVLSKLPGFWGFLSPRWGWGGRGGGMSFTQGGAAFALGYTFMPFQGGKVFPEVYAPRFKTNVPLGL
jgi:hypothetical protein